MIEAVTISLDPKQLLDAAESLKAQTYRMGRPRIILGLLAAMAIGALCGVLAGWRYNYYSLKEPLLIALWSAIGTTYATIAIALLNRKFLWKLLRRAPMRAGAWTRSVGPAGLDNMGRLYPWMQIVDVKSAREQTILMLSEIEAISFPDASLPPGITPEALRARIAAWRAAAAPPTQ